MDIDELRKEALKKVTEIISMVFSDDNFDFSNNLELVKFRIKSKESIYCKCKTLNVTYDKVYDLIGIRFVLKDSHLCYELLDCLKKNKNIKIKEVRDYIKNPRDLDEYKALHVHIEFEDFLGEIQIMNIDMHKLDEKTHDDYKKGLLKINS